MAKNKNEQKTAQDIERDNTPLYELPSEDLSKLLRDWYTRANNKLQEQRKIWDYSYLAYKGILANAEVNKNRKDAADAFGIYVNVPRTFSIIQGVRRNFNIEQLRLNLIAGGDTKNDLESFNKTAKIENLINYDLRRSQSYKEVKDAGFYKLLYGNGFLHSFLLDRKGKFGEVAGKPDKEEGRVKVKGEQKEVKRYYGMVSRAIDPYKVFPDPDGETLNVNDNNKQLTKYVCIRKIKHINDFRRDWRGVVPDEILDKKVQPGGDDMTNYESVKEVVDHLFRGDAFRYPGTVQDYISDSGVQTNYKNINNYVEERLWVGEDFYILQAGKGLQFCLIAPNYNNRNRINITKLNNIELPGEFWAMGEPYINRYQQIEENRVHNAVLDSIHFSISGMLAVNSQYLDDEEDTEIYPQKVWKLKLQPGVGVNEVMQQFSATGNNINTAMKFMEEVKQIGQQTTAITDFVTGASESLAETATETDRLSSASDLAVMDKMKEMAEDALVDVGKIFMDMYPVAYRKEKIKHVEKDGKIAFIGKKMEEVSEEELASMLNEGFEDTEIVFLDDINVEEPEFRILGDISVDKNSRVSQWSTAIDYSTKINEMAYNTGDNRRLDVVEMGIRSLGNFDVIDDPHEFLTKGNQTKIDEIQATAKANQQGQQGQQGSKQEGQNKNPGGRPKEMRQSKPKSKQNELRQQKQPNYRGKNKSENKTQK